jgi:predicted component of type VI protein secretion system
MPQLFNKLSLSPQPHSLRERVAVDIVSLLNSAVRSARLGRSPGRDTLASVLNFGNPPFAAMNSSRLDPHRVASHIRTALMDFEPRLHAKTLIVNARMDTDKPSGQRLYFDIQARLSADRSAFQLRLALDYMSTSFSVVGS